MQATWRASLRVLFAAIALPCVSAAQKVPAGTVVDGELGKALDAAVGELKPPFWGAVLAAQQGRVVLAKGYGLQDLQKVPNGPNSLFDLGGIAHFVTGIAALQLQAQKKWSLDDAIGKHLPDVPADKAAITLKQLVLHTSGLPPEAKWDGGAANARRTAIGAILASKLVDAPGKAFHFSMLNGNLLAAAIEQATGEQLGDALKKRVFAPAGMRDTALVDDRHLDEKRLTWRKRGDATAAELPTAIGFDWTRRGAHGVLSSPLDLHDLLTALTAGKLAERGELLLQPLAGGDIYRVKPLDLGAPFVELHGAVGGYRTRIALHQPSRTWLVVCSNEVELDPAVRALGTLLAKGVATAPAAPAVAAAPPTPNPSTPAPTTGKVAAKDLDRFVGTFATASGDALQVARNGDALLVSGRGLQVSARLLAGAWPPPGAGVEDDLRRCADRGVAWLQAMAANEADAFRIAFVDDDAAIVARAQWPALAVRLAPNAKFALLGSELAAPRASWFETTGKDGPLLLRVVWGAEGRMQTLAEAKPPAPFALTFALLHRDAAVALVGKTPVTLTVEGDGAGRVLVLEDATAGPTGLCEFAWRADR